MHHRYLTLIPAALAVLLVSCSTTSTPSASTGAAPPPAVTAVGNGPESKLQKGMPAEAVKRLMGEPDEITRMQSPTGKAEVWVYHRTIRGAQQQVPAGTRSTPVTVKDSEGRDRLVTTIVETSYRQQVEIIEETIRLLMFDGKYLEQKRDIQTRYEYL
ncbi:MAG: hypothetical protein PHE83_00505 [Opitutaceae bacterium]|nr:hypothetical protein [Opitutaceae bacterium]